jgi:hypothetical protein
MSFISDTSLTVICADGHEGIEQVDLYKFYVATSKFTVLTFQEGLNFGD